MKCLGLFLFCFFFFFSLVRCGARADAKIWLVTKKVIASCIPRVLTKLSLLFPFFLLLTMLHIVQTLLGVKDPLCIYFFLLYFFLFCFCPIFDWLTFFLSFFFFLWSTIITQGKISFFFFGKIFLFFLPMVRLEISILGQGYGQNIEVWLKRPMDGGTWRISGYLFSKRFKNKGMPQIISMTHIWLMIRNLCKTDHAYIHVDSHT